MDSTDSLRDGAPVRLIARPEDIEILPPAELASNQIDATVEQVDYLGDRFEYYVRAAGAVLFCPRPKARPLPSRRQSPTRASIPSA